MRPSTLSSASSLAAGAAVRKLLAWQVLAALAWLGVVIGATIEVVVYTGTPGRAGSPLANWPATCRLPLDQNRPTLLMFAHPRCPCTRASLGELERLMARCQGQISAHVFFLKPAGLAEDWVKTDLWRKASAIPGVSVHGDDAGLEARRFHAQTSGQTLLYGQNGLLMFEGGITISRGHSGDNPGRSVLTGLAHGVRSSRTKTPVFGCPLFATDRRHGATCKE